IEHIPSHLYLMCVYHHHYFFFIDQATTEIYTLSLHDALPIWVRQEDAGARVLEHELELPRLQFGVERHRDRAELGAGKDGHAERRAVPEQQGDPVAGLDAVAAVERGGEPARALGELAPGEPLGDVDD